LCRAAIFFATRRKIFRFSCTPKASPKKSLNLDDHFDRSFAPYRVESQTTKKKGTTMNPLTQFKQIRVLLFVIAVPLVIGRAYAIDTSPDPSDLLE
jgi:hypothetical protein